MVATVYTGCTLDNRISGLCYFSAISSQTTNLYYNNSHVCLDATTDNDDVGLSHPRGPL